MRMFRQAGFGLTRSISADAPSLMLVAGYTEKAPFGATSTAPIANATSNRLPGALTLRSSTAAGEFSAGQLVERRVSARRGYLRRRLLPQSPDLFRPGDAGPGRVGTRSTADAEGDPVRGIVGERRVCQSLVLFGEAADGVCLSQGTFGRDAEAACSRHEGFGTSSARAADCERWPQSASH